MHQRGPRQSRARFLHGLQELPLGPVQLTGLDKTYKLVCAMVWQSAYDQVIDVPLMNPEA